MESNLARGERSKRVLRRPYNSAGAPRRAGMAGIFASRAVVSFSMYGGIEILAIFKERVRVSAVFVPPRESSSIIRSRSFSAIKN